MRNNQKPYYPVFLDVSGKHCVVVGGGKVAQRKIQSLTKAQARVIVVAPEITPLLRQLAEKGSILWFQRRFKPSDLRGCILAIGATNDAQVNRTVFNAASRRKIPVNLVDSTPNSSFIVPSVLKKGPLLIAVSTAGASPALARKIRQDISRHIGSEYPKLLKIMKNLRPLVHSRFSETQRKKIWKNIIHSNALELLQQGKTKELNKKIKQWLSLPSD